MGSVISKLFKRKDDDYYEVNSKMIDIEKIEIAVDKIVELNEVIWRNFSKTGLRVKRRYTIEICTIFCLLFLTTPTVNLN